MHTWTDLRINWHAKYNYTDVFSDDATRWHNDVVGTIEHNLGTIMCKSIVSFPSYWRYYYRFIYLSMLAYSLDGSLGRVAGASQRNG